MGVAKIRELPRDLFKILLRIITMSYSGSYMYHTVNPIKIIRIHQEYDNKISRTKLIKALVDFRNIKKGEMSFVSKAATLSGAAVIGVFSWPATEKTVWAAKMLWNLSLFLSSFSLIDSAHQRLLRHLPKSEATGLEFSDTKLQQALSLFLQPPLDVADLGAKRELRRISNRMLWIWQCPMMLMHYSWVLFLVGYALHLLTPVFDPSRSKTSFKVGQTQTHSRFDRELI
ncbi:hypothetical protein F4821DRAFT_266088 [Hypoxylon rubiginosum]|uniref:Uncharacterized protein n=1 Tax=Hypoxylon rubiginosum TaxID=110542 RepID=A0ACC0CIQ2_9PEZI|nr:hypothetical protein F4821DRAFT_266088 [Hypoxylon rubiginosum]